MKIVVLDGYTENPGDLSWESLAALGDLEVYDRTSYEESDLIAERIGDAEIVVMNKTPISRATLDKCPNIKLIAVLATGYNVVDIAYAKEKGIPVCNVPNYGGYSVSQFSIALMLEACLHIGHHDRQKDTHQFIEMKSFRPEYTVTGNFHHPVTHGCSTKNTGSSNQNNRFKRGSLGTDSRIQEVYGVITDPYS